MYALGPGFLTITDRQRTDVQLLSSKSFSSFSSLLFVFNSLLLFASVPEISIGCRFRSPYAVPCCALQQNHGFHHNWICFLDLFLDFSWICFLTTGTAECTAVMKRIIFCLGCYCRCSFYWYHAIMILLFFLRRILVLVLVVLVILVVAILLFLVAAVFLVADRVFVFCFCCLLQLWNHSFFVFVKCHLKIR